MEHVSSPSDYPAMEDMFAAAFRKSLAERHNDNNNNGAIKVLSTEEVAIIVQNDLDVDREANILATVEEQIRWLQDIGFESVDCYFKYFILALFGGVKPKDERKKA